MPGGAKVQKGRIAQMVSNTPGEPLVGLQTAGKPTGQGPGGITAGAAGSCWSDLAKTLLLVSWRCVGRCIIHVCVCVSASPPNKNTPNPQNQNEIHLNSCLQESYLVNKDKIPMSSIQLNEVKQPFESVQKDNGLLLFI